MRPVLVLTMAATAGLLLASCASMTGKEPMSFFVSSTGSGKGADLGGLAGADALCQKLTASGICECGKPSESRPSSGFCSDECGFRAANAAIRKRGRPTSTKDRKPRKRRTKAQMAASIGH